MKYYLCFIDEETEVQEEVISSCNFAIAGFRITQLPSGGARIQTW